MILLTLSRGKGEETVRLQLPASPAEIGETFAFLDRISLDTTATAILDVSSNVPVLYRCLYDVDVEDSEQFQKLQKLAERTVNCTPFVRQYGILLGNGVFFYAKGSTEQTIHSGIQKTGDRNHARR